MKELKEVLEKGNEFVEPMCYSGDYMEQVYTKEMEDGGIPYSGILYEKYPSGNIKYYCEYENGVPNGEFIRFYDDGSVLSIENMDKGTVSGIHKEYYPNGNLKLEENCQYGIILNSKKYGENGEVLDIKAEPTSTEKILLRRFEQKYGKIY